MDGKVLLRKLLTGYTGGDPAKLRKQGFSGPGRVLVPRREHRLRATHPDAGAALFDVLEARTFLPLVDEHLNGKANHRLLIWSLLCRSRPGWTSSADHLGPRRVAKRRTAVAARRCHGCDVHRPTSTSSGTNVRATAATGPPIRRRHLCAWSAQPGHQRTEISDRVVEVAFVGFVLVSDLNDADFTVRIEAGIRGDKVARHR